MSESSPLTALVEYQIRPENNSMQEWLAVWDDRGEDARVGEPETTAYATAVNLDNPLNVLVFERYQNGNESLQQHIARPAHDALMTTMGDRKMTKRRVMSMAFNDVENYGWWRRPDHTPGKGVILTVLGIRFPEATMRDQFFDLTGGHAEYCWEHEPDTLIYSAGIASRDADREVDVKSGDLIVVMACSNQAAVEKHSDDPNHVALGGRIAELGIEVESPFMRTYSTTGNGFLWR